MSLSRPITAIAVTQVSVILIGFFTLRFFTLPLTKPDLPNFIEFSKTAVFLHHYGGFLLLIPAIWIVYALRARHIDHGWLAETPSLLIGISTAITIAFCFLYTAFTAWLRC